MDKASSILCYSLHLAMKPCGRQNSVWDGVHVLHHNFVSDPHVKTENLKNLKELLKRT